MTLEYKATVLHKDGKVIPVVDEYLHGAFHRSITFLDAPEFNDMFSAYVYARTESDEMNRRVHHEER